MQHWPNIYFCFVFPIKNQELHKILRTGFREYTRRIEFTQKTQCADLSILFDKVSSFILPS